MNAFAKVVLNCIAGLVLGVAALFLLVVAAVGFSYATETAAIIPGVFRGWFTRENDMPALNFEPNGPGMLIFVLAIAIAYVVGTARIGKRLAKRRNVEA